MSLNYNLCDDWGWYIDIEKTCSNYEKQIIKLSLDKPYTDVNTYYNDDEYNYYLNINKNSEFNTEYHFNKNDDYLDNINDDYLNITLNIATTSIITAILTYIILFP